MVSSRNNFLKVLVAALGLVLATGSSAFAGVFTLASDQDYLNTDFVKQFGGDVRWGNGTTSGDWEYSVVNGADTALNPKQKTWSSSSSNSHSGVFTYTGSSHSASLDLGFGATTVSTANVAGTTDTNTLLIRVKDSAAPYTTLTDILVNFLVDHTVVSLGQLVGDGNSQYLGIKDSRLAGGFTISFNAKLWGPRTSSSDPLYMFKVGTSTIASATPSVPEPFSASLLGFGLAGLKVLRRRQRKRSGKA